MSDDRQPVLQPAGTGVVPEAVADATAIPHPSGLPEYKWVYLWRWPLRVTHWVSALTVTIRTVTVPGSGATKFYKSEVPLTKLRHFCRILIATP